MDRYHRQSLLPQVGPAGQARLAAARVFLVGCGALGTVIAEQLVRAGVGHLTLADRDVVELTNLQRQTLYTEHDAADGAPKAIAAATRLRAINSTVEITPLVTDIHPGNLEDLLKVGSGQSAVSTEEIPTHDVPPTAHRPLPTAHSSAYCLPPTAYLLIDGTDNVSTRYLLNDVAVKHRLPWVYGAAVATEGRVLAILPGQTPCLRCLFPTPPAPTDLPTCDTAGVLGMGTAIVGAFQAMQALKILVGHTPEPELLALDFWPWRLRQINVAGARNPDCPCCAHHHFDFLTARPDSSLTLCGRNAIQIRPTTPTRLDLPSMATRLATAGPTQLTPHLLRCHLTDPAGVTLTLFPDGRSLIQGTNDPLRAKSLYARYVGL